MLDDMLGGAPVEVMLFWMNDSLHTVAFLLFQGSDAWGFGAFSYFRTLLVLFFFLVVIFSLMRFKVVLVLCVLGIVPEH